MVHHAIIVTSWDHARIADAHAKAKEIFGASVSDPVDSGVNGYRSFFVAPDGSKDGWDESVAGDRHRTTFVEWLRSQYHGDGSSTLQWVEVQYGDNERNTRAKRSSDKDYSKSRAADEER